VRGVGKGHRLRTIGLSQTPQGGRRQVQGLVPTEALPPGIRIALGAGTPHGVQETLGVVDQVGGGAPLGTQGLPRGMGRVGLDGDEPPILHDRDAAALGAAQGTVSMDALCGLWG
jgi:hypothetical protein